MVTCTHLPNSITWETEAEGSLKIWGCLDLHNNSVYSYSIQTYIYIWSWEGMIKIGVGIGRNDMLYILVSLPYWAWGLLECSERWGGGGFSNSLYPAEPAVGLSIFSLPDTVTTLPQLWDAPQSHGRKTPGFTGAAGFLRVEKNTCRVLWRTGFKLFGALYVASQGL